MAEAVTTNFLRPDPDEASANGARITVTREPARTRDETMIGAAVEGSRRRAPIAVRWAARTAARARQVALTVAGLAGLSASAWTVNPTAGLAAIGVSCLALEYLTTPKRPGQ